MITMCKETGSCYVEQEDRGGLYVKRYKSRPPVAKCVCGKEFSEETQTHLYVTGSNVYDHICDIAVYKNLSRDEAHNLVCGQNV